MHDPDVVVFDLHLPIPVPKWRFEGEPRWELRRRRRTNAENLGEPVYPWFRPAGYTVAVAGRRIGLYRLATIWHSEPQGRDSGTVCKGMRGSNLSAHNVRWALRHRSHLHAQWHTYQRIRSWLFTRCEDCGHRFFWKQARIGTGWDAPGVLHPPCSNVRHLRYQLDDAAKALTFTANHTERWRVERWLAHREGRAEHSDRSGS